MNVIFGASGHAREIAFILRSLGQKVDFFIANDSPSHIINEVPVIPEDNFFGLPLTEETVLNAFVAIGNNGIRKAVVERVKAFIPHMRFPNLFHPSVIKDELDKAIEFGEGNIFFPGTIMTTGIRIGNHNHFNSNASISHDCEIGDFNTISPRTTIAGNVRIGNFNFFGTGAVVINNLSVADNLTIGAGAIVINNLSESGTYLGIPAKRKL